MGISYDWNGSDLGSSVRGGLIFTNSKGQVIFADSSFMELLKVERRQPILGKPLHRILGVEHEETRRLLEARTGSGDQLVVMNLRDREGQIACVEMESIPAYDQNDRFLGINIIVRRVANELGASLPAPAPAPVEVSMQAAGPPVGGPQVGGPLGSTITGPTREEMLNRFFLAQVDTLQVLLARVAGLRVRESLESIYNDVAQRNQWATHMIDGNVHVETSVQDPNVYGTVLSALADYAAIVVGWRMVVHEMTVSEHQFGPSTLDCATDAGLRAVYVMHEND